MRFLGYQEKNVRLFESLYLDTACAVAVDGELSELFITAVVVLQGCVLSLCYLLEVEIALALNGSEAGIHMDGTCNYPIFVLLTTSAC